ncbi:MAG: hypothetical protein ACK559_35250, partial [bacterium]
MFDTIGEHASRVRYADPAPVLSATSDDATGSEPERQQHLLQCSALCGQNNPQPHLDHSHAKVGGSRRCCFPFAADIDEEATAGCRMLVQDLVTPVTVEADCGGTNECFG